MLPWFLKFFLKVWPSAFTSEVVDNSLRFFNVFFSSYNSTDWLLETFLFYSRWWRYMYKFVVPFSRAGSCGCPWAHTQSQQQSVGRCGLRTWSFVGAHGLVGGSLSGAHLEVHGQTSCWSPKADRRECIWRKCVPSISFAIFICFPSFSLTPLSHGIFSSEIWELLQKNRSFYLQLTQLWQLTNFAFLLCRRGCCFPPPLLEKLLLKAQPLAVSPWVTLGKCPLSPLPPNLSLFCSDGTPDSPLRQAGPPQLLYCL